MKTKLTLILFVVFAVSLMADAVKQIQPADGLTVSMLYPLQHLFCLLHSDEGRRILSSPEYRAMFENDVKSRPKGVELSWAFTGERGAVTFTVEVADNDEFANARRFSTEKESLTLHNLKNGQDYFWKVIANYGDGRRLETAAWHFTVESDMPRLLYVPGVVNFRDIGGLAGLEGRIVPQGLIYRSAGLNANTTDGKTPGPRLATDEGVERLRGELGLRTELDLRGPGETAGMKVSPVGADINYVQCPLGSYKYIFTPGGMKGYASAFRVLLNPANYPLVYHCIGGADRTGSLSFMLEALLGYSKEAIFRDYVLTSFWSLRPYERADELLDCLNCFGTPDESLVTKAERYFFAVGISPDEIEAFRAIVFGPGLAKTPGCLLQRRIDAMTAACKSPAEGLELVPFYPYGRTMSVGGKDVPLTAPVWNNPPFSKILSDGKGGYLVHLFNRDDVPRFMQLKLSRQDAKGFCVMDLLSETAFAKQDGSGIWSPDELGGFVMELPVGVNFLLSVAPAIEIPKQFKLKKLSKPVVPISKYLNVPSGAAPVIDGVLDDEIWSLEAPLPLPSLTSRKGGVSTVRLRTDKAHETLFIGLTVIDSSNSGHDNGDIRDADDICSGSDAEIFISAEGREDYFQFIFNRFGNKWDAHHKGPGRMSPPREWNAMECQAKTAAIENGWTLEVSIPFKVFDFTTVPEINVCLAVGWADPDKYNPYRFHALFPTTPTKSFMYHFQDRGALGALFLN